MEQNHLYEAVEQALGSIRPYLEADGGDVKVLEITEDRIVRLELLGACGSCPMSAMTFRAGIEEAIRREVPQVQGVEAINLTPANVR
ncbi:MAG: NifU family protein [Bacteroidetes bacterium]|nr:NifU family protein [Bacteroidota bacterium]